MKKKNLPKTLLDDLLVWSHFVGVSELCCRDFERTQA